MTLPRRIASAALVVLMIIGSIVAAWVALDYERERAQQRAEQASASSAAVLSSSLRTAATALNGVGGFHLASEEVTASEFAAYADRILGRVALVTVGWTERVTSAERTGFEQSIGRPITERGPDRELIPAGERPVYYPVVHVASQLRPPAPVGIDVAATTGRRLVIGRAAATGEPSLTGVVPLIGTGRPGVILYQAAYTGERGPTTPAERRATLLGIAAGSFAADLLIEPMLASAPSGIRLAVRLGDTDLTPDAGEVAPHAVSPVAFGGQTFEVIAQSPAASFALPLAVLLLGLALTALAAAVLVGLAQRYEALERRDVATREFLMRITHDLRTPLTAIRGHAAALADGVVPDREVPRSLTAILSESGRLEGLVADLLDLARLDADRFSVDLAPMDVGAALHEAVTAVAAQAAQGGVTVRETAADGLPVIVTDDQRVRQIVGNLLDNAIRWSPRESSVDVDARPIPGGGVLVTIRDAGPGVEPERRDEIFAPFSASDTPDGRRGPGLGLAISRELARALGGDLRVDDARGGGSLFTLTLPARSPERS
jgi:signal transduction histidine kinase